MLVTKVKPVVFKPVMKSSVSPGFLGYQTCQHFEVPRKRNKRLMVDLAKLTDPMKLG